jgi:hypothetical protein
MGRLYPQVGCLTESHAGGIIHNRQKEGIEGLLFETEPVVVGGTAGEWPLGEVAPQILFLRAVGTFVERLSVRGPVERAKRDRASWKDDRLRPLSGRRIDRDADRGGGGAVGRCHLVLP